MKRMQQSQKVENELINLKSELLRYKKIAIYKALKTKSLEDEIVKLKSEFLQNNAEKRNSNRLAVSLVGEIVIDKISYTVLIENVSENGIYMKILPTETTIGFSIKKSYKVKFKLPSGKTLSADCNAKWSCKPPPHFKVNCVGSELIDPSPRYIKFIKSLNKFHKANSNHINSGVTTLSALLYSLM
jgi:hypothetical protein